MCFSARVQQDLNKLARRFGAEVAWEMFAELFKRRLETDEIVSRGLEWNFEHPQSELERRIKTDIDAHREKCRLEWEADVVKQKERLAKAEQALALKETKTARKEFEVSHRLIKKNLRWLQDLKRGNPEPSDDRIYSRHFASVIAIVNGRRRVMPMRYLCRLAGKPENYDTRFQGAYNARRDNLMGYWRSVYGRQHAVMVVHEFFENVPLHLYEKRELTEGEKESNVVLRFNPNTSEPMLVACLWDHWTKAGKPDLYSYAAITDEPPAEIAATGHQRCIISLHEENLDEWLSPESISTERLEAILTDKVRPYYEHEKIAA